METVRVLTLNLWGEQPPLDRRLDVAEASIRALAPDVIGLQEVREVPGSVPNTAHTLAGRLGYQVVYETATPWGGGNEGLALLSRLPILRHEAYELPHATSSERRILLGAALATDQGELAIFTTHLNYRLAEGVKREDQVFAIDQRVAAWTSPLPKIVMGDFNAAPEHDEIRFLLGQHTLGGRRALYQDAWRRHHSGGEPGLTWSRHNPYTQRLRWLELDRRIDYVFVTPLQRDGRGLVHDCRVVLDNPVDGVHASDHYGLFAEIQLAPIP